MTLSTLVLSAILATVHDVNADDADRLRPVANAIADEATRGAVFAGPDGPRRTALLLVAIGKHESSWRQEVRDCRVRGDHGRARTTYQMQGWATRGYALADVCHSDALQAYLAARALRRAGGQSPDALLAAYAGTAGPASRAMAKQFQRLVARWRSE